MTNEVITAGRARAKRLLEIRSRLEDATKGEWRVGTDERIWCDSATEERCICQQYEYGKAQPNWENDMELLGNAYSDIEYLLELLGA